MEYCVFNTGMGWMGICGSAAGVRRITFPCPSAKEASQQLGNNVKQTDCSADSFRDLAERLKSYFNGGKVDFPDKLDFAGATPFQRKIWETARLILYGEVRSYAWVAGQINRLGAARAVGQALGQNPFPIVVPCHRVLTSDGKMGGYRGGVEIKRQLLQLEASASSR